MGHSPPCKAVVHGILKYSLLPRREPDAIGPGVSGEGDTQYFELTDLISLSQLKGFIPFLARA